MSYKISDKDREDAYFRLLTRVNFILLNHWDPLGVKDIGLNTVDEYTTYSIEIIDKLISKENPEIEDVVQFLDHVEEKSFSRFFTTEPESKLKSSTLIVDQYDKFFKKYQLKHILVCSIVV